MHVLLIDDTCYNYFCRKKFLKIKIDKTLHKIDYATRNIKCISYINN